MAIVLVDLGTVAQDGEDGDNARQGFTKVNDSLEYIGEVLVELESRPIATVHSVNNVLADEDGNVELSPSSIGAATTEQGSKADTAVQPSVMNGALNEKVDKVTGYGLSQENFTPELKSKLESLDNSGFSGIYASLGDLESAIPEGDEGDWALIDESELIAVKIVIWSTTDEEWQVRPNGGGGGEMTPEEVKLAYESNPDTNAFTDDDKDKLDSVQEGAQVNVGTNIAQGVRTGTSVEVTSSTGTGAVLSSATATEAGLMSAADKAKLTGVAAEATKNQTDTYLLNRENHSGTQPASTINDFSEKVLEVELDGLSTSDSNTIVDTDKIIEALGKLQAQINEIDSGGGGVVGGWVEGDILVTEDYTTPIGKNAMRAGPIVIDDGVMITVSTGSTLTIV